MEQLTTPVYECTLPVEAHMICDLLSQAGISARVDGEFLAGAGGELPLGNTIKVRVDPSRATEAREVIADWEKSQPAERPSTAARPPIIQKSIWFAFGLMAGVALSFFLMNMNNYADYSGTDYNFDGTHDEVYHYVDGKLRSSGRDRNFDGTHDSRCTFSATYLESVCETDDDFNGRFEWKIDDDGTMGTAVRDEDADGRPEQVMHLKYGVVQSVDYYFASGGRIVKREHYQGGELVSAEFDDDRDGVYERRVEYDAYGEPKM